MRLFFFAVDHIKPYNTTKLSGTSYPSLKIPCTRYHSFLLDVGVLLVFAYLVFLFSCFVLWLCRLVFFFCCLRFTKFCWVGQHMNIIMKPMNSPRRGQPNPRKIGQKWHLGHFYPHQIFFWWVGIDFVKETDNKKSDTKPNSPQTPYCITLLPRFFCYFFLLVGALLRCRLVQVYAEHLTRDLELYERLNKEHKRLT